MLIKDQMVNPKLVAKNWNKEDGSPYLFFSASWLQYEIQRPRSLVTVVKDNFSREDLLKQYLSLEKTLVTGN